MAGRARFTQVRASIDRLARGRNPVRDFGPKRLRQRERLGWRLLHLAGLVQLADGAGICLPSILHSKSPENPRLANPCKQASRISSLISVRAPGPMLTEFIMSGRCVGREESVSTPNI